MATKNSHPREASPEQRQKVSRKLTLDFESWFINKKPKTGKVDLQLSDFSTPTSQIQQAVVVLEDNAVDEEEEFMAILIRLTCYKDPWTIRKKLTNSDVDDKLCRFLVKTEIVEDHVLNLWEDSKITKVKKSGVQVRIFDVDTRTFHELTFKRWSSNNSYIFNNNWKKQFVIRRVLKNGDEIGMFWFYSYFCFSVLKRASSIEPALQ